MSAWLGYRNIDDALTFAVNTHSASTGAATDADAVPSYRVYEDETGTPILTGTMAKLDDSNTTGFYSEQLTLSAANGFEAGKCYSVYISAAVSSVTGTTERHFSIWPAAINSTIGADVVKISGDSVAADNLESYTDGTTPMPVNVTAIAGQTANASGAVTFPASIGTSTLTAQNVWDYSISGYTTAGLAGTTLLGAGSAGDPWSTALPGSYAVGTAGRIIGDRIDVAISTRLASGNVTVGGFTTGAITSAAFGTGALTSNAFAAGAIAPGVLASTSITNTTFTNGAITAAVIATGAITADEISSNAAQEIANAVWSANITNDYAISPASSVAWANDTMGKRVLRSSSDTDATEARVADAVWDETTSGHTTAGTYGGRVLRATNSNVEVQVTGSNHVAADVHEIQAGVITSADFAAGAIDANALAASATGEIAAAVWDETLADHLTAGSTGAALDGAGGGGSTTTFVTGNVPYQVRADQQFPGGTVDVVVGTLLRLDLTILDRDGNAINLTGGTVTVGVRNASTGATVGTDQSATLSLARLGMVYVDTIAAWSTTPGSYRITVSATVGSDVIVAGPLAMIVRSR